MKRRGSRNVFKFFIFIQRKARVVSEDRLRLDEAQDISPGGLFVLKMPAYKSNPTRRAVELNAVDASGSPTKKRGLVLRSKEELDQFRELFQFDKLVPLLRGVDGVNPQVKKSTVGAKRGEDVLEI